MSNDLRLTIAAIIWPGPIGGPLPITVFKVLTPILIIAIGIIPAIIFMGTLAAIFVLFFLNVILEERSLGRVNEWVAKMPRAFQRALQVGTITALLPIVLFAGPFPLALSFRFLKFKGFRAKALLVIGSYVNAILWTGIVWGGGIGVLKNLLINQTIF